ncbi:MAG TPA: class I SAM-dependent methyltransferase [Caulobacteraceae bacterium]|nr:class I SAM-dependent methyltransferase [Caulobacteraceae bacterium]
MNDGEPSAITAGVYGDPPLALEAPAAGAAQLSPRVPGAAALEALPDASLQSLVVLAPPGVLERRFVLAHALRALKPGGRLTALAPKDRGGLRLKKELEAFGCTVGEDARRHHRICVAQRPAAVQGVEAAIADGAPRRVPALGLVSQPGVFSWDRMDPGSALLASTLPALAGDGAELGCGNGWLALRVLESPAVKRLVLVELDRRAVEAARANVADPRAEFVWADVRSAPLSGLDFVVMNPPFHDGGAEDKRLGQAFIGAARQALAKGGVLWMVANRHLPYEATLGERFAHVALRAEAHGFKVFEART